MQPDQFQLGAREHPAHGLGGSARGDGQPELLILGAGREPGVRARVDAGYDPQQHLLAGGRERRQRCDLVE